MLGVSYKAKAGDRLSCEKMVPEKYKHKDVLNAVKKIYRPSKEEFEDPFGLCAGSSVPAYSVDERATTLKFTTKLQPLRLAEWNNKDKITFFMRGRYFLGLPRSALRLLVNEIPINYHHCGRPKLGMEFLVMQLFSLRILSNIMFIMRKLLSENGVNGVFNILQEKTTMVSPKILLQYGVLKACGCAMPGEFVITFPRAYHSGFSHGREFAIGEWFPFGAAATERYALLGKNDFTFMPIEIILTVPRELEAENFS
ncbi:hypothetical protein HAX54_034068 [Datura stramonium]|uniref:JmjC domain-containing protein n=1 Tax=Datura stramonium TaxID=4076 RepID=A0ABS8SE95_DATST|nr:hypothetical protein [Datura stramonium]